MPEPPPITQQWIRYLLGFTVSVAIGLAPFLGKVDVPLFDSLLGLIPTNLQETVLPLSAALMGIIAVSVQWYASERINRAWLGKWFSRTLMSTFVSFLVLSVVHTFVVVRVHIRGGEEVISTLVGFARPVKPPCSEKLSDSECLEYVTLDPAAIESFWGSGQIRLATLALILPYLIFMGSFGLLVGLFLIKERQSEGQLRRRRNRKN